MTHHEVSVFNPHSPQTREILNLFYFDLVIAAVVFAVVAGLVIYAVIHFRHKPGASEPFQDPGNTRLETLWTIIPGLILLALLIATAKVMHSVNPPVGEQKPNVIVIAHQWWWEFRYPNSGVVAANEMHMPYGTNWLLQIESADVIHDFWVPSLGAKMDAVPGNKNYLWMHPETNGTFIGTCAEYCGAEHALMGIRVIVESPSRFEQWTKSQLLVPAAPSDESARRGASVFATRTCANCHAIAGTQAKGLVGPDLTHLADRETLGANIYENSMTNLVKWLKEPQKLKPGMNMPDLRLTSQEANDLAVYLLGMKSAPYAKNGESQQWN
jgi:cytochrome c oxidase subunit II